MEKKNIDDLLKEYNEQEDDYKVEKANSMSGDICDLCCLAWCEECCLPICCGGNV